MTKPCPFCPDGHQDPAKRPWSVHVASSRDGDGQPIYLNVGRPDLAHIAECDAEWLRNVIRNAQATTYTYEQVATALDRLPAIMDKMQHLTGERALGRNTALFQLQAAIAQVKDDLREPGKDHRRYLTMENLQS